MSNLSHNKTRVKTSAIYPFIFVPVLFYPPLLFTPLILPSFRIGSFALLVCYLFWVAKHLCEKDSIILFLLSLFTASILTTNFGDVVQLNTAGNMLLTLVFAYALSRAAELNDNIKKRLVGLYIKFFTLVPICSLLSVIFFLIFGTLDIYNLPVIEGYNYLNTPFGVMLDKDIFGFHVYRSQFFFIEPVYLALFCTVNIFVIAPNIKSKSRFFLVMNVIGGLLTFSYLFYILSAVFFVIKKETVSYRLVLRLFLIACAALIVPEVAFFADSSMTARTMNLDLFVDAMDQSNVFQLSFGHGFPAQAQVDAHYYDAGILTSIYEIGIVNVVALSYFLFILSNKNIQIFLFYFAAMMVFEPLKLPLFWVLVVVSTVLLQDKSVVKDREVIFRRSILKSF